MKANRILSLALALISAASITLGAMTVVSAKEADIQPIAEAMPQGNALAYGSFDDYDCIKEWNAGLQRLDLVKNDSGGYLKMSGISVNYAGFTLTPSTTVAEGTYKFTGYFRTANEGEVTGLRMIFSDNGGSSIPVIYLYPTSEEWLKVETYVTFKGGMKNVKICGQGYEEFVQSYCVDNFSLVKVDKIPDGETAATYFGTAVTPQEAYESSKDSNVIYEKWDPEKEAQYKVNGIIINQDADGFITGAGDATVDGLKEFVYGFEGSHVTDYMICVNNTNATFPSETWTDIAEKYTQKYENGNPVDYTGDQMIKSAYQHFIVNGLDYIDIWCETFPEIGINPWLSFRMNDAHDLSLKTSKLLSDYFHENPQIRRVQHGVKTNTYYDNCQDYTHELVRDHMLDLINEALSRYDCYGIELDWQREIWLWYNGGEYNGLDILNDFMREVDRLVKVYEVKYGHEIKIAIRCASDIQTNYDFGLDIMTWAAEGIIDQVTPTGRWSTTDNDMPIRLWASLLHPYGIIVAPGIETRILPSATSNVGGHTLETLAAISANSFSQGADKIYLFNMFLSYSGRLDKDDRITTNDAALGIGTGKGYWNMITTIGSYDKLMTLNRRMILTYNDTRQLWRDSNAQLPKMAMGGNTITLRIPIGDVPAGSTLTLKLGANEDALKAPPTVYVNSKLCTYNGYEYCMDSYTDKMLCYNIPAEVHNEMYAVIEVTPSAYLEINYAEIYLEVAKAE